METFTALRSMIAHPRFDADRATALDEVQAALGAGAVDAPLVDVVRAFVTLPHVFTLQCRHRHLLCEPGQETNGLAPIPDGHTGPVRYRMARVALCLEPSARCHAFKEALARLTAVDPARIRYGSADWFWEQWPDSYAGQVEPDPHRVRTRSC